MAGLAQIPPFGGAAQAVFNAPPRRNSDPLVRAGRPAAQMPPVINAAAAVHQAAAPALAPVAPVAAPLVAPAPAPLAPASLFDRALALMNPAPPAKNNIGSLFPVPTEKEVKVRLTSRENCLIEAEKLSKTRRAWLEPLRERLNYVEANRKDVVKAMGNIYELHILSHLATTSYSLSNEPATAEEIKKIHDRHEKALKELQALDQLEADIFFALKNKYNIRAEEIVRNKDVPKLKPLHPLISMGAGLAASVAYVAITDPNIRETYKSLGVASVALPIIVSIGMISAISRQEYEVKGAPETTLDWSKKQVKAYAEKAPYIGLFLAFVGENPYMNIPKGARLPVLAGHLGMFAANAAHDGAPAAKKVAVDALQSAAAHVTHGTHTYLRNGWITGVPVALIAGLASNSWAAAGITYSAHAFAATTIILSDLKEE